MDSIAQKFVELAHIAPLAGNDPNGLRQAATAWKTYQGKHPHHEFDFSSATFKKIDLTGASFQNMDFKGVRFEQCHLQGVQFTRSCMSGATFTGGDASSAVFESMAATFT